MPRRIFTAEEANRTLPLVRRIVSDIQERYRAFQARRRGAAPEDAAARDDLERMAEGIQDLQRELDGVGCFLKDYEKGLVDWYAEREGDIVYLCWMTGEDRLGWWHPLEGGFAERRPLDVAVPPAPSARAV